MIKAKGPTARLMANELRLADHFPRNPKACRAVADTFFACFSEKSVQPPGGVSVVSLRWRWQSRPQSAGGTARTRFDIECALFGGCVWVWAGQDKEAGRRGLAQCKKEMEAYDACMLKFLKKNQPEFFRVRPSSTGV